MSLIGHYGSVAKMVAHKLLNDNVIDFLGTDLHRYEDINTLKKLLKSNDDFKKICKVNHLNKTI